MKNKIESLGLLVILILTIFLLSKYDVHFTSKDNKPMTYESLMGINHKDKK